MSVISEMVETIVKRPFIIVFTAVVTALLLVVNMYNPVLPLVIGLTSITRSTIFESIVSGLQLVSNPKFIPLALVAIVALSLLCSLLGGIVLSGLLFLLNRTLDGLPSRKGEFSFGIRRYFGKIFFINLRASLLTWLFGIFLLVCCVPAIVVTKSGTTDRPELLAPAILVDILTGLVVLFALMFFATYTLFWYPPVFKNVKNAFRTGKQIADKAFWGIFARFLIFTLVFAAFQYLIFIVSNTIARFAIAWLFWTFFSTTVAVFVFSTFKKGIEPSATEELKEEQPES